MSGNVRTLSLFADAMDAEFAWRAKELAEIRLAVKAASGSTRAMLIRAGIALLYAHWEGFVKNSSTLYVEYVNRRGLLYKDLQTSFIALGLRKRLNEATETKKHSIRMSAVEFVLSEIEKRAELPVRSAIQTRSNLNSEVFENIGTICGITLARYEPYYNLVDESLLKRRNAIAHGEYLDLGADEYLALSDEVRKLMRWYKDDIDNAAATGAYKKQP